MNKPYALIAIVCCIVVLGLFLLPACSNYQPVRSDSLVLSSSVQETVPWADLSSGGRCPLDELRRRLGDETADVWVSDRGNSAVVLSAALVPLCYLGEDARGMYTLYSEEVSLGTGDNVFLPLPSVEAVGVLSPSITVETPTSTREMTVKAFCLECGLWEYVGSAVSNRVYTVESFHRKTVTLTAIARERACVFYLQNGKAIDAAEEGNQLVYWYRGNVCLVGQEGVVTRVVFGSRE